VSIEPYQGEVLIDGMHTVVLLVTCMHEKLLQRGWCPQVCVGVVSCLVIILPDATLALWLLSTAAFVASAIGAAMLETSQRRPQRLTLCQPVSPEPAAGRSIDRPALLDEQNAPDAGLQPGAAAAPAGVSSVLTTAVARRGQDISDADEYF
jgi:hypothetical protein